MSFNDEPFIDPPWPTYGRVLRAAERNELPGQMPLQQWEDISKLNVEIHIYGGNNQRGLVRMHLPKGDNFEAARMTVLCMSFDLKHSRPWSCEFCGEPVRETHMGFVPYIQLSLPVSRMPTYVHFVCDLEKPSCQAALRRAHDRINAEHAGFMGPHVPPTIPKRRGEIYPLAASCAECRTDASAQADMKRCGACKLTRYCSANCQRKDWPRHKVACKCIKSVEISGF